MIKLVLDDKSYANKQIFKDTILEIKKNEFVGIKGESGSGKSTLINILGLLDTIFTGEYYLDQVKINCNDKSKRVLFSYMFQIPYLIPYLDAYENIVMPLKNKKMIINEDEIDKIMEDLQISDLKKQNVNVLSGGEKTRISLARAIASKGKILLIDEPTANLDPTNASLAIDCIIKTKAKYDLTIIMVTHSNEYDNYFDRIITINNKKLVDIK